MLCWRQTTTGDPNMMSPDDFDPFGTVTSREPLAKKPARAKEPPKPETPAAKSAEPAVPATPPATPPPEAPAVKPAAPTAGKAKPTLAKVSARTAAEICKHFALGDEARPLLRDDLTPRQYLDLLMDHQHYADAVRFLAHALPKREAVWWACLCGRSVAGSNPPLEIAAAFQAAETWVRDPSEENRRAALAPAQAAELRTPAGCAAFAAFWSGGSLAPPNVPAVPPGEYLTAHGVAGGVITVAVSAGPDKAPPRFRLFLLQGIDVANGASVWK
jgi:hypothetical protein